MSVVQTALSTPEPDGGDCSAYSFGSAFASYDEQRKGTLKAGMLADIVVLSATSSRWNPPCSAR